MTPAPRFDGPHRRYNPLTGEWVLVSAQRTSRPWLGQVESPPGEERPRFDPNCYLCPGTTRAEGARNPQYRGTFVFDNDFPALLPDPAPDEVVGAPYFQAQAERGICRVVCFSPRHDLTLARMDAADVQTVIDTWASQTSELGREYRWVQVFENSGAAMGASNPHPHGQIWAGSAIPSIVRSEDEHQRAHHARYGEVLLSGYAAVEAELGERVIVANDDWLVVVPYWAVWPFETLLLPRRHFLRLPDLDGASRAALASALVELLTRYDNLFEYPFPYSMGWHGAPFGNASDEHWLLHAHVYPPLLRSATVRKFMVGYELLAEAQRDLTAESAATRLQEVSDRHYVMAQHAGG